MNWLQFGMGDQKGVVVVARPWGTRCGLGTESFVDEAHYVIECSRLPQEPLAQVLESHASSGMMRVLVRNFGEIPVIEQCKVTHQCRSFRESRSNGAPTQFVFDAGRWNWVAFAEAWQRERTGSPFLQQAHLRAFDPLDREGVWKELADANCVSMRSRSTDELCCDLVTEFTGGRIPLVDAVVSHLKVRLSGDIEKCLLSILGEVVGLHEVVDAVRGEWLRLGHDSRRIVATTMYCHLYRVRLRDTNVVDALLSGLVVQDQQLSGPGFAVLTPSCKCIETVMFREVLVTNASRENLADVGDSCVTVMAHAYRKTLEIECLLRQLLVSYWTVRGLGVRDAMDSITVRTRERSIPVSQLFKEGQRAAFDVAKDFEKNQLSSEQKHTSLLASAADWQLRQFSSLDQSDISLMAYATAKELEMALENDKVGLVAKSSANPSKPFQQEALRSIMDRFRPIRNAVAHCQPLCISSITVLDGIREELVKMIATNATSFVPAFSEPEKM